MIRWENEHYAVVIDEDQGILQSLRQGNREFICQNTPLPLFEIRMRDEKGETRSCTACDAAQRDTIWERDTCRIRFSGFPQASLTVTVMVAFQEAIDWRISVVNGTPLCLEWIDFPQFTVPNKLKGTDGDKGAEIFWGFNEGVVVDDLRKRENSWFPYEPPEYPSKGTAGVYPGAVETQFMAYYDRESGLYIGAHDAQGHVKGIDFYAVGDGIKLQFRLFTGLDAGQDFYMDYGLVIDFFIGDWHEAAEIYRRWFDAHKSDAFHPVWDNPYLPRWYADSPIVVTYPVRGRHDVDEMTPNKLFPYMNAMQHIERLARELDSRILVILMHWEGTAPWAPPYVWPPYGGEEALHTFIEALHAQGHLLGLYCSGLGWTLQSRLISSYNNSRQLEEEGLRDVMCLAPDGSLPLSNICPAQRTGYDLCPTQAYTREVIGDETQKMAASGVDYIQILDQNHGGTSYFCYSRRHGHPMVPGKWQTDAMKQLLESLRRYTHAGGRQVLLGCESAAAEPFIPYLLFSDNRYNLTYFLGRPVPAYAYIYHEYVNNFMGNQVCANSVFDHTRSPQNLLYRIAYAFCAGDMLTLVMDENGQIAWNWGERGENPPPEQQPILDLVRRMNAWRKGAGSAYLHEGRMVKPLPLEMGRSEEMPLLSGYTLSCAPLLTSRWRAADGRTGQFLVNYRPDPATCRIRLDGVKAYTLRMAPQANAATEVQANGEYLDLSIEGLSVALLETVV